MEKTLIDHKSSKELLERCAAELGTTAKPEFESGKYDHAFSRMIECGLIEHMIVITSNLAKPLSEIRSDKKLLLYWHYCRHVFELFFNACGYWGDVIDYKQVLETNFIAGNMEVFPNAIADDIAVFSLLAIYFGADAATYRKMINSKTEKTITKMLKKDGIKGCMAFALRSCIAYMSIDDRVVDPALKAIYSGKDNRSINHFGDAVNSSGLSKMPSTSTKSKRCKSVDLSDLSELLKKAK